MFGSVERNGVSYKKVKVTHCLYVYIDMKTVKKLFYIISNFLSVIINISYSPFCKLSNKHRKHDINI